MQMSIFDQFRFCFIFLGLPKIGPNLYLRLLLVASLLFLGYDATASSNGPVLVHCSCHKSQSAHNSYLQSCSYIPILCGVFRSKPLMT